MHLKMTKTALLVYRVITDARTAGISFDDTDVVLSRAAVDTWLVDKPDLSTVSVTLEDIDYVCKRANTWLHELKSRKFIPLSHSQNALAVGFIIGDLIEFHTALESLLVTAGVVEQTANA